MAVQNEIKRSTWVTIGSIVVVVVLLVYAAYTYLKPATPVGQDTHLGHVDASSQSGRKTPESEQYKQTLSKYNDQHAAQATHTGSSYISVPNAPDAVHDPFGLQHAPVRNTHLSARTTPPVNRRRVQQRNTGNDAQSKAMLQTANALVSTWSVGQPAAAIAYKRPDAGTSKADGTARDAGKTASAEPAAETLIAGYAEYPGIINTSMDTDTQSVVQGEVTSGPFKGARLFSPNYRRLGKGVDITFNAMAYQGETYKVEVKAMDDKTGRTTMSGSVSHHYISRLILPSIAAGLAGAGQLYAAADQKAVVGPLGGVTVGTPTTPRAKNVEGTFIGASSQNVANLMNQAAAQISPIEVRTPRDMSVGFLFMQPVTTADAASAQDHSTPANAASTSPEGLTDAQLHALQQSGQSHIPASTEGNPPSTPTYTPPVVGNYGNSPYNRNAGYGRPGGY